MQRWGRFEGKLGSNGRLFLENIGNSARSFLLVGIPFFMVAIVFGVASEFLAIPDTWYLDAVLGIAIQYLFSFVFVETYVLYRHLSEN